MENMLKQNITPQEVCEFMNELIAIDEECIRNLINARVRCNIALANHETVQVGVEPTKGYNVGFLGVLNGLFGVNENQWGCLIAHYGDDKKLIRFDYNPNAGDKQYGK